MPVLSPAISTFSSRQRQLYLVGDCITPNMQVADWFGVRAKEAPVHHSEACCTGYVALSRP